MTRVQDTETARPKETKGWATTAQMDEVAKWLYDVQRLLILGEIHCGLVGVGQLGELQCCAVQA